VPLLRLLRIAVLSVTLAAACVLGGVAGAGTAAAVAPAPERIPCRATVRACVRLSTNQAWLLDDGKAVLGPVRISHGRAGYRTPPGRFRVSFKDEDHISSLFDAAPMPFSVFFNGGIAFHQGSVRQRSHGCIHLPKDAAREFFATLEPGDRVEVVP
jgi:lipoprotein-anchoring transpeptidase ErfK/SrfK